MAIDALETTADVARHAANRAKGKRSKRQRSPPAAILDDVYELAVSLMALSRGHRSATGGTSDNNRSQKLVPSPALDLNLSADQQPVLPAPAKASASYPCSECGKAFYSYQALGGHKTTHRKTPSAVNSLAAVRFNGKNAAVPPAAAVVATAIARAKLHKCSICFRTFPTGQALGGHKRLHYDGGASFASSATAAAGSVLTSSTTSEARPNVELDLNAPALPEVEFVGWWTAPQSEIKGKHRQEGEVLSAMPPSSKKPRSEITSFGGVLADPLTPLIRFL